MDAFVFAVTRLALGRFSTASSPVAPTERLSMRRSSTPFLRLARGFPASFLGNVLPQEERRILMNADFTTCHAFFLRDRPAKLCFREPLAGPVLPRRVPRVMSPGHVALELLCPVRSPALPGHLLLQEGDLCLELGDPQRRLSEARRTPS